MKTTIAYSLDFNQNIEYYYPTAYIVEIKNDQLGYMQRLATKETVGGYSIKFDGSIHETLFKVIDEMSPFGLETYFNKGRKKSISLQKLFQSQDAKLQIHNRLDKLMCQFMGLVVEHKIALCLNIERKVFCEQIRIDTQVVNLRPLLRFEKTQIGLKYGLKLYNDRSSVVPFETDLHIITKNSGWIVFDYKLAYLEEFNGNKLIPFIKKNYVFVPDRIVEDYFQKFIKDVIGKVEVEVEGFDKKEENIKPQLHLDFREDLTSGNLVLMLSFVYGEASFSDVDSARQRVIIDFVPHPEVRIINRDFQEEADFIEKIKALGLISINNRWGLQDSGKYDLLNWLSQKSDELSSYNISYKQPYVQGKKVCVARHSMSFSFTKDMDWFELKAVIQVGQHQIIFADLLTNIANEDNFFLLPSGEWFVIPSSWMDKYSQIAKFAKIEKGKVRLKKTHFTLLGTEEKDTRQVSSKSYVVKEEQQVFTPSAKLKVQLRQYQLDGYNWLCNHYNEGFGALLADDMGLGKTIQTIAFLLHIKESLPVEQIQSGQLSLFDIGTGTPSDLKALIIVPASLVFNWVNEIRKFAPHLKVYHHVGSLRDSRLIVSNDVTISTYHTVAKDISKIKGIDLNIVVLDESHYIKNRQSKLFKSINQLNPNQKLTLSGTPIENSLSDLYTQMEFINPDILGKYEFFKKHFQIPIEKHANEEALSELNELLEPFILRRTKKEVLKDLPELSESVVYCEMSSAQKKMFESEKAKARNYLLGLTDNQAGMSKLHIFNQLLSLRKIANHPILFDPEYSDSSGKFEEVLIVLDSLIKARHKVLVFSSFVEHLNLFRDHLVKHRIKHNYLTGSIDGKVREREVTKFESDEKTSIFLISLKAGGVGLNLTSADYVIILDPWWNPFAERQAVARAHRIGQKNKVNVIRFISKDSIEEKIITLQQKKLEVASGLIDLGSEPDYSESNLEFLLS